MSARTQVVGTKVIGVVNVTPDSFSDGGQWLMPEIAVAHARHLLAQGADMCDVGGESTRPGAARVAEAEELDRVLPVVTALTAQGALVSVDTMRASVAAQVLDAGAWCINDVSGGLADPEMAGLVAERGCDYVVNHWRGHSDVMQAMASYDDVVADVHRELMDRVGVLTAAGVAESRIILDPGLGFAKGSADNWRLLANLHVLTGTGLRVLIGASRKRFLGQLLAHDGVPALPTYRDRATAAVTALVAAHGVWGVRVHEVAGSVDAVRVATAWRQAAAEGDEASVTIGTGEIA